MFRNRLILVLAGCCLLGLVACSLNPFGSSGGDNQVIVLGGETTPITGFTQEEVQTIIGMVSSGPGLLVLPIQVPATDSYRFEFKNELGGNRLAVVLSYDQAKASPTYGIETTARVLLLDAKARGISYHFDRPGYAAGIASASVDPVVQAMIPYYSDVEFLLRSNLNIGSVPAVVSVVDEVAAGLPVPVPASATVLTATGAVDLNLRPLFSVLSSSALMNLIFNQELRGFYGKVRQQGLANSPLFSSNVKAISSAYAGKLAVRGEGRGLGTAASSSGILKSPPNARYEEESHGETDMDYAWWISVGFRTASISMDLALAPVSPTSGPYPFLLATGSDDRNRLTYSNRFCVTPVFTALVDEAWFLFGSSKDGCSVSSGFYRVFYQLATYTFTIPEISPIGVPEMYGDFQVGSGAVQSFLFPFGSEVVLPAIPSSSSATLTTRVLGTPIPTILEEALVRKKFLELVNPTYDTLTADDIKLGARPEYIPKNPVITCSDFRPVFERGVTASVFRLPGKGYIKVSSVLPKQALTGSKVSLAVTGEGLSLVTALKLYKTGANPISATGLNLSDSQHLSANLDLVGAQPGSWSVSVSTVAGYVATWPELFSVMPHPLTVATLTPSTATSGMTLANAVVTGTGFVPGISVSLKKAGQGDIAGAGVTVDPDGNSLTATFDLSSCATGSWNVFLRNPDGQTVTKENALNVISPAPVITGIDPTTASNTGTLDGVKVTGEYFRPGLTLLLFSLKGGVAASNIVVAGDGRSLTCSFNLKNVATVTYMLLMTNPDGQVGGLHGAFTVVPPAPKPVVTAANPNTATNTGVISNVAVAGSNMKPGATVRLSRPGYAPIPGTGVSVAADGLSLTCSFNLTKVATGSWNLDVTNPDGQAGTKAGAFTVTAPPPTLGVAIPNTATNTGVISNVKITGTNFLPGLSLSLFAPGKGVVTATNVVVAPDGLSLSCSFNLTGVATVTYPIFLVNGDGQPVLKNGMFTVTAPLPPPVVTAVSPDTATNTGVISNVAVTGTGFWSGASVRLYRFVGLAIQSIPGTGVVVAGNGTSLTASFDLTGIATGTMHLQVVNSDGQTSTKTSAFTVTAPAPILTAMAPNTGTTKDVLNNVTVTGQYFVQGVKLSLFSPKGGVAATNVLVAADGRSLTCSFNLAGLATITYGILMQNPDGQSAFKNSMFTVTAPAPAPTISAITPNTATNTGTISGVTVTGTALRAGATVTLSRNGHASVTGSSVTVAGDGLSLTCAFALSNVATGSWNLVVTNPDNQSSTKTGAFTVTAPAPVISALTPSTALNTGVLANASVTGSFFKSGAKITLFKLGSPGITGSNVTVAPDGQSLACSFNLTGVATGSWILIVGNPDGQTALKHGALTVTEPVPAPTIAAVSPNSGLNTGVVSNVTVTGTNIQTGATVALSRSGFSPVAGSSVVVGGDGKSLTCSFDLSNLATGAWNVAVSNPDGQSVTGNGLFTVTAPGPTVAGMVPGTAVNDGPVSNALVTGTYLRSGATVRLSRTGYSPVQGSSVVVAPDGLSLTCSFAITGIATGPWNLEVTNPDGQVGSAAGALSVTAPAFAVSSMSPNSATNTGVLSSVTISGTLLQTGGTVVLTRSGTPLATAASIVVAGDGKSLTCSFDLTGLATGPMDLVVTNPGGQRVTGASFFTVFDLPAPLVTAMTPNTATNTGSVSNVTVSGSNLQFGASVWLTKTGEAPVQATSIVVAGDGLTLTCTFNLTGAKAGSWNLLVTNPDGQSVTGNGFFVVTSYAPTLTALNPSSSMNTGVLNNAAITGDHFQTGATVFLYRSGQAQIPGTSVLVDVNGQTISCSLDLTSVATGAWDLVVTNPDGKSATGTGFLTVATPAPETISMSPDTASNAGILSPVTVTGANFRSGTTVALTRNGSQAVLGTAVVVAGDGNSLTCSFDLNLVATGVWDLLVTNPDGQNASGTVWFTLTSPVPTVTSMAPDNAMNTGVLSDVKINGSFLRSGVTAFLTRIGHGSIEGKSITVDVNGQSITCSFDLTDVATGSWNLVVTSSDNDTVTKTGFFTVNTPAPAITSMSPTSAENTTTPAAVTVNGTGFKTGISVVLAKAGQTPATATQVVVAGDGKSLTCSFDVTDIATGTWDLTVTNTDGQGATSAGLFTVTRPPLSVTAMTPNMALNAGILSNVTITGTSFASNVVAELGRSGEASISATIDDVATHGRTLTCSFNLTGTATGSWHLKVSNPLGESVTKLDFFTVGAPAPTFASLSPTTATNSGAITGVDITGSGFKSGLTVELVRSGQTNVQATDIVVAGGGLSLQCSLPLGNVQPGLWGIVITNPDTQEASAANVLTVVSAPVPVIASVNPAGGVVGTSVTLTGTSLGTGGTLKVGSTSVTGITSWSDTEIVFTVPSGVLAGTYDVAVTPTGAPASDTVSFQVMAWKNVTPSGVTANLNDVTFEGTTGWIAGMDLIMQSLDSGNSWNQVPGPTGTPYTVDFRDILARNGEVRIVARPVAGVCGYYIDRVPGSWAEHDQNGSLELFALAGTTIPGDVVVGGTHPFYSIGAAGGQMAYASGTDLINVVDPLYPVMPTEIPFIVRSLTTPDGQFYYAVGETPVASGGWGLAKSTDKGHTWTWHTQSYTASPPNVLYLGVQFLDTSNGWAVGASGTVIHTADGGTTWAQQTTPGAVSGTTLRAVFFNSATDGTVVGDGGVILSTANGGTTWTAGSSGTTEDLRSVHFTDSDNGWIVGGNGIMLKTVTGGK